MSLRTFAPGQELTFIHALGTPYEEDPVTVTYGEPYAYGFDEHVVFYPDGTRVAVLDRDLTFRT